MTLSSDGFLMLLLPIIRNISMRPVQVFTRMTPQHSMIVTNNQNTRSLSDHDQQLFYDIRIKLIRGEFDSPGRSKNLSSISESKLSSKGGQSNQVEIPVTELSNSSSSSSNSSKSPSPPKEIVKVEPVVSTTSIPPVTSLFSIGSLIGSLYYGGNKSSVTLPHPQQESVFLLFFIRFYSVTRTLIKKHYLYLRQQ